MAWSQTDIETVERAIIEQSTGKTITSITIDGDTTTYAAGASPTQLITLLSVLKQQVNGFYPRSNAKNGGRG
ncbi:MAG: hypothetical protein COA36_11710 [Desulfotalea sp.]|nr:MAG: hypothetical protein COA36_11710 [Desulfotalea sp.]